ncbi:MAG: hypothetical protein HYU69_02875 [Bacteroidetes bacterium]|nr:hypothetical protein [Bacteroidota bacterium]
MNEKQLTFRQAKLELIASWPSSGLSVSEFCKQNNFPEHQFYYWNKIQKDKKQGSRSKLANNFVPVKVVKQKQEAPTGLIVELVYPNGIKLKFYSPINFSELRSLTK